MQGHDTAHSTFPRQGRHEEDRLLELHPPKKKKRHKKRTGKKLPSERPAKKSRLSIRGPEPMASDVAAPLREPDDVAGGSGSDGSSGDDSESSGAEADGNSDDEAPVAPWILRHIDVVETLECKQKKTAQRVAGFKKWLGKGKPAAMSSAAGPSAPSASSSGAAGSADAPPLVRDAGLDSQDPGAHDTGATRKKSKTEQVCVIPGIGEIHYYPPSKNFVAFCRAPNHYECRKSRTANPPALPVKRNRRGQGRPIGLLAEWLYRGRDFSSKEEHGAAEVILGFTHEQRLAARRRFLEVPGALEIVQHERAAAAGESEEPHEMV